jgi:phospholipid/cholesterol/gamma-HCH transport system substrate-binding protein
MAKTTANNIRLGLFVMAGLLLLILGLYIIGKNRNMFGASFLLKAHFRNAGGLVTGNNVRFSGIEAGTVKSIRLINDTTIEVTMVMHKKVKPFIRKNAGASIGAEGLIGNRVVNIVPGQGAAPFVEDGDLLAAKRTSDTDQMLQTLDRSNENIAIISEDIKAIVKRVNNSAALWALLNEYSLVTDMKASLHNLRQASEQANATTAMLSGVVRDVQQGKGSLGALLTDTSFAAQLSSALEKIESAGNNLDTLTGELNQMVRDVSYQTSKGKGAVQALLRDSMLAVKLGNSLDNVEKGTAAFNANMEALKHNFLLRGYFRKLERREQKANNKQ